MESNVVVYNHKNMELRTVMIDEEAWFVAKDVCDNLGLNDVSQAVGRLDDDEKNTTKIIRSNTRGNPNTLVINESGLYSLILTSTKPTAKKMKKWVTSEVLPSIRKHGMYATEITIDNMIANPDFAIKLLQDLKEERVAKLKAEQDVEDMSNYVNGTFIDEPKIHIKEFASAYMPSYSPQVINALCYHLGIYDKVEFQRVKNKQTKLTHVPNTNYMDMFDSNVPCKSESGYAYSSTMLYKKDAPKLASMLFNFIGGRTTAKLWLIPDVKKWQ